MAVLSPIATKRRVPRKSSAPSLFAAALLLTATVFVIPLPVAAATMTGTVAPVSSAASVTTNYGFNFTLESAWGTPAGVDTDPVGPLGGNLVITFPAGTYPAVHDVSGAGGSGPNRQASVNADCIPAGTQFPLQVSANVVTILGVGTGCGAGDVVTVTLPGIKNPGVVGLHNITLETQSAASEPIDKVTVSVFITGGTLTGVKATRSSQLGNHNLAGATTTVTLEFTLASKWVTGRPLIVTFPELAASEPRYGLTNVGIGPVTSDPSCTQGQLTPDLAGPSGSFGEPNVLTLNRSSAGNDCPAGTKFTVPLTNVKNPASSRLVQSLTLRTGPSNVEADEGSVNLTKIDAGTLTNVLVLAPASSVAGAVTTYQLRGQLVNPWPADGMLEVRFTGGYQMDGASVSSIAPCNTGTFTTSSHPTDSNILFIRRGMDANGVGANGDICPPNTLLTFSLAGVKNPTVSTTGNLGNFNIRTKTAGGRDIDVSANVNGPMITPGQLVDPTVEPTPTTAAKPAVQWMNFTLANPWPANGKFVATFPSAYSIPDLESVGLASISSSSPCVSSATATKSNNDVTVARPSTGGSSCPMGTTISIALSGIPNPASSGSVGNFAFKTTANSVSQVIDTSAIVPGPILTPGVVASQSLTPSNSAAGAFASYRFDFVPATTWPAGGSFAATFPDGYSFGDVSATIQAVGCTAGSLNLQPPITENTVILTRSGATACPAGTTISIQLNGVKNPPPQEATINFETRGSLGAIDTGSGTVTITSGLLTDASVTADDLTADQSNYTIAFTLANEWPDQGFLVATFPASYDLAGATLADSEGCNGAFAPGLSGPNNNVMTIARGDGPAGVGEDCDAGTAFSIRLIGINKPTGTSGQSAIELKTLTEGGSTIDQASVGILGDATVAASSAAAGAITTYQFTFTLANAWNNEKFVARFPASEGFDLTGVAIGASVSGPCAAGASFATLPRAGEKITVVRSGSSTCPAGTLVTLNLAGVRNPIYAHDDAKLYIQLVDAQGTDTGTVHIDIVPNLLGGPGVGATPTVVADDPSAGANGTYTLTFRLTNDWPAGGRLVVDFPDVGYDLANVTVGDVTGCDAATFSKDGESNLNAVNVTHSANCAKGSMITLPLDYVVNPNVTAAAAGFSLMTFSGQFPIDQRTVTGPAIDPGVLGGPGQDNAPTLVLAPSAAAGATDTDYTIRFTLANDWPMDGKATLAFPASYPVFGDIPAVEMQGCHGALTVGLSNSRTLVAERDAAEEVCESGQPVTFTVQGITNPSVSGLNSIFVNTMTASGTVIDGASVDALIETASLTAATVLPVTTPAGNSNVTYQFSFKLNNTWPSNGRLVVQFPDGYTLGNVQKTITHCTSGSFAVGKSLTGATVTLTRGTSQGNPAMDCLADGTLMTVGLSGINNAGSSGPAQILLQTRTGAGSPIDQATVTTIVEASGQLTGGTVNVDNPIAGQPADYTFAFTTTNPWPANGKLMVDFPSFTPPTAYNLTGNLAMIGSGCSSGSSHLGTFTSAVAGRTVVLSRGGGATTCSPGNFVFSLSGAKNAGYSGPPGMFVLRTTTGGNAPVDIDVGSVAAPTLTPASLGNVIVTAVDSTEAGQLASYSLAFTPSNRWGGSGGKLLATFPAGYDVSSVSPTVTSTGCTGFSAAPLPETTTVVATHTGADCPALRTTLIFSGIRNTETAGAAGPMPAVKTATANSVPIDQALDVATDLTITPGPAAQLNFTTEPANGAQLAILASPTVTLYDAFGNPVTTETGHTVTVSLVSAGDALLSGVKTRPVVAGTASFAGLNIDEAGTYTLLASSDAGAFTNESAPFIVAPVHLAFIQEPIGSVSDALLSTQPTVQLLDPFGQVVQPNGTKTITVALATPGGAILSGTNPLAVVDGNATFSDLKVNKTGTYTLTAILTGSDIAQAVSQPFTTRLAEFSLNFTSGPVEGGTKLAINGSGFANGATVTFGALQALDVTFLDASHLTAVTPAHAVGPVWVNVTNPDGHSFNATAGFTFLTKPSVLQISPAVGSSLGGTIVGIKGNGFESGAIARFGTTPATTVVINATHLNAVAPAHPAGRVNVTVSNANGLSSSLANAFDYTAANPPAIVSLSPVRGATAGGTSVVLTGSGFAPGAQVTFGTNAATAVTFTDASHLTVVTPAHAPGAVAVNVTNPDGQHSSKLGAYTFLEAPALASLSVPTGPSTGGTKVILTGENFLTGATVKFGTAAARVDAISSDGTTITVTTAVLSAMTAANPSQPVDVVVTNPDGQKATLANGFTYLLRPGTITLTPALGTTAGGTSVTIAGSNFVNGATVEFDGATASVTFKDSSQIVAIAPAHAAGSVNVVVTNPNGMNNSAAYRYALQPGPFTAVPSTGTTNGGETVTLTGTNFLAGSTVKFGTTSANATWVSSTSMKATAPVHAVGATNMTVTSPDGLTRVVPNAFVYTLASAPQVTAISPGNGSTGMKVTLTGTGFVSGTKVSFGGVSATDVSANATKITAKAPAHAAGAIDVVVTNPDGQKATLSKAFTYVLSITKDQIVTANKGINVTVVRIGGTNHITWKLPTTDAPAEVQGVQLWRSNSPYTLVETFPVDSTAFTAGLYNDSGESAKPTTRYLVTMYYGASEELGRYMSAAPPTETLYGGTAPTTADADSVSSQLPTWALVLVGFGVVFLGVLVSVLIARKSRARSPETQGWGADQEALQAAEWGTTGQVDQERAADDEWLPDIPADEWQPAPELNEGAPAWAEAPAPLQQVKPAAQRPAAKKRTLRVDLHNVRCPACSTTFELAGLKPVKSVCPGCGARGTLS